MFQKAGIPNLLNSNLIKKWKIWPSETRAAGGVINRRQILNFTKAVVKANNPSSLKEFSGKLELTDQWGRDLLEPMEWNKCKEELEKLNHCHNSSQKKKKKKKNCTLKSNIYCCFQIWLSHFPNCKRWSKIFELRFTGKIYLFIIITFAFSLDGEFLLIQLIYQGKSQCSLPKLDFPLVHTRVVSEISKLNSCIFKYVFELLGFIFKYILLLLKYQFGKEIKYFQHEIPTLSNIY